MQHLYKSLLEALPEELRGLAPTLQQFTSTQNPFLDRVKPTRTLSISLTDQSCQQNCAHCNAHYLKGMQSFSKLHNLDLSSYEAALISGGSTVDGEVPIKQHLQGIFELPQHLKLNLHVGYQSPEALLPLKARNPVVSFDLPASDSVIKEVYGLKYSREDFRQLYLEYCRHFKTVAHLTIGLCPEDFPAGEENTLRFLATNHAKEVVALIFRPTPGTRMADVQPPELAKVISLMKQANEMLACPIHIGCMRPAGPYRRNFDILAWMHGCRKFVMPDHQLVAILEKHQVMVSNHHNCCAL
ncbi:MAG: radical SAM protein [Candidatus Riflebacteria bacterium]|nr:radical SAM protein [Candidatus Riflebacteria bacterium]